MLRIEITKEYTKCEGDVIEILTGLACFTDTLRKKGVPEHLIKYAVDLGLNNNKKDIIETILDTDNLKIHKIDLNKVSKEELKKILFD